MGCIPKGRLRASWHQHFFHDRCAAHQALRIVLVCALALTTKAVCFGLVLPSQFKGPGAVLQVGRQQGCVAPGIDFSRFAASAKHAFNSPSSWILAGCALAVSTRRQATSSQAADRDFEMEQLKLRVDQLLYKSQSAEEEKQKALDRIKPLEKTIKDLRLELETSKQETSTVELQSREESERLSEARRTAWAVEQDKEKSAQQIKALEKTITDLKDEMRKNKQRTAGVAADKQDTSVRLNEALEDARRLEQEKGKAVARVRALEKALQDSKRDVANSRKDFESTRQEELRARTEFNDLTAERDALSLRLQRFQDAMNNIMELASGALNDPDNDPFVLLERATKEAEESKLKAEELERENMQALAKRDEAMAALEPLESRISSMQESQERAERLSKLFKDIAKVAGVGDGGLFGIFQAKKSDEDLAEDVKTRIEDLKKQR
eukprot:TRINITY_DN28372_c0_g1_i1.p1 TRINITY_DN28372_c0_g1~~TRINITY_DN28372_c0_g1_i1.p1  ORF type:complete len:439 (+),score=108.26 TRINITY_DN28372_c0_g1_i1:71-1387(+)